MMKLTIGLITSRLKPEFNWFFESLLLQVKPGMELHIILVDLHNKTRQWNTRPVGWFKYFHSFKWVQGKPSVFQGEHRLTSHDVWDASSARNTVLCMATTDWVAFLDDRCVLQPGWLSSIEAAMDGKYAIFGGYEKRHGITVKDGAIDAPGEITGVDTREIQAKELKQVMPWQCPGKWSFGCNLAVPLKWGLEVNGWEEDMCGGVGFEDVFFGQMLQNNGAEIRYDYRMKVILDRTPGQLDPIFPRLDKGPPGTELDKTHAIERKLENLTRAPHHWDLTEIRKTVQAGGQFPIPTEPRADWFDGEPLEQLK